MTKTFEKLKKAALHWSTLYNFSTCAEITPNLFCAHKSAGPVHPPSRQALEHPAPGVQFLQSKAFTVVLPMLPATRFYFEIRNLEQQIWDNAVSRQVEVLQMWRMAVVSHVSSTPGCAEQGKSRRNFHDLHCLASTDRQPCTPSEDCNLILLVHVISVIPCLTGHVACTKSTGAFLANGWTALQPWHRPAAGVKSAEVNIWF